MKKIQVVANIFVLSLILILLSNQKAFSGDATVVRVAFAQAGRPISYVDDDGNATGFDVEVFKLVDERLPEYEFRFIPTTDDDLLIGVETGKYQVGLKNTFYTAARAEKYIYPKNNLGASESGFIVRAEDADKLVDLEAVATLNKKLLPIAPQDAQYYLVQQHNDKFPDKPINVETSEAFTVSDWAIWLTEGRYDAYLTIRSAFASQVESPEGAHHDLVGKLAWNTFTATKTWPLFNKNEQALADAYDRIIVQLKSEGAISGLLIKFLGKDTTLLLKD
jgi:L-cystine transport system substrate-binding protein